MQIVKDYRDNKVLRDSFNGLTKKAPMDTADDWANGSRALYVCCRRVKSCDTVRYAGKCTTLPMQFWQQL